MKDWLEGFDLEAFYGDLSVALESRLNALPSEIDEYSLIVALGEAGCFDGLDAYPASLALFAKHFLTRHGVYHSRGALRDRGIAVDFELMRFHFYGIYPQDLKAKDTEISQARDNLLAEFYGDLDVLAEATQETVQAMLTDFWQRFAAFQQAEPSKAILGVEGDASWSDIQSAYRKLAAKHHPDKGGEAVEFNKIKQAYEALKRMRKPR